MPAVILLLAYFGLKRDQHSPKWCRKKLIGPLRERLHAPPPKLDVLVLKPEQILASAIELDARALRLHCAVCGKCAQARE